MGPGYPFPRPEGATAYDVIPRKIPYQGQDGDHNPEVPQQTCVDTHSKVAPVADRRVGALTPCWFTRHQQRNPILLGELRCRLTSFSVGQVLTFEQSCLNS